MPARCGATGASRRPVAVPPTSTWTVGQTVRDQVPLVLPADAPPGRDTLRVRLGWLRPNGERLPVRRWLLPAGDDITLPGVQVVEQEGRTFEAPSFHEQMTPTSTTACCLVQGFPRAEVVFTRYCRSLMSIRDMEPWYAVFVHWFGVGAVTLDGQEYGRRSKRPTSSPGSDTKWWLIPSN